MQGGAQGARDDEGHNSSDQDDVMEPRAAPGGDESSGEDEGGARARGAGGEREEVAGGGRGRAGRARGEHAVHLGDLQGFLRLIAGRMPAHDAMNSNEELVSHLLRGHMLTSQEVQDAMLACPRAIFIPRGYEEEAYVDAPIRVSEDGFNISAPHMHASALEALAIRPGDSVLDVGFGCGLVAAAAAFLAGREGEVVGLDIRDCCLSLSRRNLAALADANPRWAEQAAKITLELRNVFVPSARHSGRYHKVHVGAMCPEDRLPDLLKMLRPEGGRIVAPVDNDFRVITRASDGTVTQRILSQVRFSELEIPRDVEVVEATLQEEDDGATRVSVPASTWATDLGHMAKANIRAEGAGEGGSEREAAHMAAPCGPDTDEAAGRWQGGGSGAVGDVKGGVSTEGTRRMAVDREEGSASGYKRHKSGPEGLMPHSLLSYLSDASQRLHLGPPDCELHGSCSPAAGEEGKEGGAPGSTEWRLPAHHNVLSARCELYRARSSSGMRDARSEALSAPEGVSRDAVAVLLRYVYLDEGVSDVPLSTLGEVVHVGMFFGVPRLVALCERQLAAVLSDAVDGTKPAPGTTAATPHPNKKTAPNTADTSTAGAASASAGQGSEKEAEEATDAAAQLLALAEETGLMQLKAVAVRYIAQNFEAVSRTEAYHALPRHLVDEVAGHCAARCAHVMALLTLLSRPPAALPRPSFG